MMEQDRRSLKTKLIILIILSAVFIPFSISWYGALEKNKCTDAVLQTVNINSPASHATPASCQSKYDIHWAIFYGVNGVIYGLPAIVIAMTRKNFR